jgi:hypothetical protein
LHVQFPLDIAPDPMGS